ncbi:MAG: general secretion pathway protein GspK [Nitrospirae bacterium]|nr:general secretion pathway protein GspK [Nitrospirota bacterium]
MKINKNIALNINSQKGIALMMVIWVLAILMVIVFSFSFMARTETLSTLSFKNSVEKKFLAEAGIERAIMEIYYRSLYKDQTIILEGTEVWKTDGTPYKNQLGEGYYTVSIMNESGKIDINKASDLLLRNLFVNYGLTAEQADSLVDCIMDWKDRDDLYRLNGAESDYYMSLPKPYRAKDAPFETLEELILVKGMTYDILYGNQEKKGIIDFLTVYSRSNKININAAPFEVLMAIPGMTPEIADMIIEYRKGNEIKNLSEVGISADATSLMAPYISISGSNIYTINSKGTMGDEKEGYTVRATVSISDEKLFTYLYYKSPVET